MKIDFYFRYQTEFGQMLAIVGNIPALGNNELDKAVPLGFFSQELWHLSLELDPEETEKLHYRYVLIDKDGEVRQEGEKSRRIQLKKPYEPMILVDTWNDEAYFGNVFY